VKSHHLSVRGQLISLNFERKMHHMTRADAVRQWRTDAGWEAKAARLPHLERISIVAQPFQRRAVLGDAGNHLPSVKAIIDGLVDVGVLDDDGPDHVTALTLLAPRRATHSTCDAVSLELVEAAS
jgi:crossover junction endodeoxyribonuclease RusA